MQPLHAAAVQFHHRAGVLTCYDKNLIENPRITALLGAEILIAHHQTGGCRSRSPRAMGAIAPGLWERRKENPDALRAEFQGPKGRGWLMRWLPSRAHDNGMFLGVDFSGCTILYRVCP